MAKPRLVHVCQSCGHQTPKWLGQCPGCSAWGTLCEEILGPREAPAASPRIGASTVLRLTEVLFDRQERLSTGIGELDRVLGGGLVAGSLVLLAGDPGIGKSTLLLSALDGLARLGPVLYVSAEESASQTKLRADRLQVASPAIALLCETNAELVLQAAEEVQPRVLAVDSIQALRLPELGSAPGSVGQVREVAARLMAYAKAADVATILVGHVTKEGTIAGPRVLEHLVDTVLYFEGDRGHAYRILRAHKNRFGSTNEIGVFEMADRGLREVTDPSALFLSERPLGAPGSAVVSALSGTRPLLYEIQALASPSPYGTGRRTCIGIDGNRLALLAAVLEKKAQVDLVGCDLYLNVAGGATIDDPAADLAVVAALASSVRNRAIDSRTVVLGEVGLAGEVRAVVKPEVRLAEARKLGFRRSVLPAVNLPRAEGCGLELCGVTDVQGALSALLDG
jgi:DNA repair protein RadA/Sms